MKKLYLYWKREIKMNQSQDNLNTIANVIGTGLAAYLLDIGLKNYKINKYIVDSNVYNDINNSLKIIINNQNEIINLLKKINYLFFCIKGVKYGFK